MKGKYITTDILMACLSKPPRQVEQPKKKVHFYWDHLDERMIRQEKAATDHRINTAA